jgi:hypothetical protein
MTYLVLTVAAHDPYQEGGAGLIAGMIVGGLILAYQYLRGNL